MKKKLLAISLAGILSLQALAPALVLAKSVEQAETVEKTEISKREDYEKILKSLADLSGEKISVEKKVDQEGNEIFAVTEGNLKDSLEIKKDGDIYLDGKLLYMADYDEKEDLIQKVRVNVDQKNYTRDLDPEVGEDYEAFLNQTANLTGKEHSVRKETDQEGNVFYYVTEGDLKNTLEIKKNGDMYIDGVPTYVENYDDQNRLITKLRINARAKEEPEALAKLDKNFKVPDPKREILKGLPQGLSDANLEKTLGNYHKNISFEKPVKDLTYPVFEFVLLEAFGLSGQENLGAYREIYDRSQEKKAATTYLTCKGAKRKEDNLGNYDSIEKVYTEFYSNMGGKVYFGNQILYLGYDE